MPSRGSIYIYTIYTIYTIHCRIRRDVCHLYRLPLCCGLLHDASRSQLIRLYSHSACRLPPTAVLIFLHRNWLGPWKLELPLLPGLTEGRYIERWRGLGVCAPDHFIWIAVLGASTVATSSDQCQLAPSSDLSRLGCAFEPHVCMTLISLSSSTSALPTHLPTHHRGLARASFSALSITLWHFNSSC